MYTSGIKIIDSHAHPIFKKNAEFKFPFWSAFSEGFHSGAGRYEVINTIYYQRSLRMLARLYNCREDEVEKARKKIKPGELFYLCCSSGGVESVYLDDGFLKRYSYSVKWHAKFINSKRILRIEMLAEELAEKNLVFSDFIDLFSDLLIKNVPDVVAFKSIIAYRFGLDYEKTGLKSAKVEYNLIRGKKLRLDYKKLLCYLLEIAMLIAVKHNIPMQFHTGFGDADLNLLKANPLYLSNIFKNSLLSGLKVILLHAGYPYYKEAAWLASVYPNVYIDIGLAVPSLSYDEIDAMLSAITALCPFNKIIYSSDAHFVPELYYIGSITVRNAINTFLSRLVKNHEISSNFAETAAAMILRNNAAGVYER